MSIPTITERCYSEGRKRYLMSSTEDGAAEKKGRRHHPLQDVSCHFINPLTGETLFCHNLKEHADTLVSVGFVFRLVMGKLGCTNFSLKIGTKQLYKSMLESDAYQKFFRLQEVKAIAARKEVLKVEVIRLIDDDVTL